MNNGINLVVKRVEPQAALLQKRIKLLRIIALSGLGLVTLVSIVLFIMIIASPLPNLREKESNLFTSLNQENSKIQRVVFVDKQLDHIQNILATRTKLPAVLSDVLTSMSGIRIVTYSSTPKAIEMTLETTQLSQIESLLNTLTVLSEQGKIFSTIVVSDLNVSPSSNSYQFRVSMTNDV